jgi:hypothetical protein
MWTSWAGPDTSAGETRDVGDCGLAMWTRVKDGPDGKIACREGIGGWSPVGQLGGRNGWTSRARLAGLPVRSS